KRDSLKRILRQLAEINSGKMYVVEDPRDLRGAFEEVASELRSAFVLNYYTNVAHDGRWHDIKIAVSQPKYKVHCRKGFYAKSGGPTSLFSETDQRKSLSANQAAEIRAIEQEAQRAAEELRSIATPPPVLEDKPMRVPLPVKRETKAD